MELSKAEASVGEFEAAWTKCAKFTIVLLLLLSLYGIWIVIVAELRKHFMGTRGIMAKTQQVDIPYLDPTVQHVGISRLRALNVTQLRELDKTLVIQDNDKPLAVLLKYEHFLAMQEKILKAEGQ